MRELYRSIFLENHGFYLTVIDVALITTMITSVFLFIIMKLYNPRYKLDKALLLRESAIALILVRFVKVRFFGVDFALWTPLLWGFLAFSSIAVLFELIREHFLIKNEKLPLLKRKGSI